MTINISKTQAMKSLPKIDDSAMKKAIDLALWLILDQSKPLKYSIDIASKKHNIKPKVAIERLVRSVIPEEFFLSRSSAYRPIRTLTERSNFVNRMIKMNKIDKDNGLHMKDIVR